MNMARIISFFLVVSTGMGCFINPTFAADPSSHHEAGLSATTMPEPSKLTTDPTFKPEVEKIVENYLLSHPEILIKMTQAFEKKQVEAQKRQADRGIVATADKLFNDRTSPVAGNPLGKKVVVEFFDYQCGHCKHMKPVMEGMIKANPDVKVIYKLLPVFGEVSQWTASAALSAYQQDKAKFEVFHQLLLSEKERLSKEKVMALAKQAKLDVKHLEKTMQSELIKNELNTNLDIATQLMGVTVFTPVFVVAELNDKGELLPSAKRAFLPGAVSQSALQKELDEMKR